MPPEPNESQSGDITRRDLFQGRFWKARIQRPTAGTESEALTRRRASLVMRYPRTQTEVEEADSEIANCESRADSRSGDAQSARRRSIPLFRPPGAIDEPSFLAGCTRCGECQKACPHDAIVKAPERMREAAGTPTINADHQACLMCEDYPCIASCEPGVLSPLIPPMLGTARVTEHLCLAHHGTTCTVCSERCPVDGAIAVVGGKPTVNETACTGCGVCRYVCPAPENAILLMPAFLRPTLPKATNE